MIFNISFERSGLYYVMLCYGMEKLYGFVSM